MVLSQVLTTRLGPVEVMYLPGDKPPVFFFPGGHCRAASDCGWRLYTDLGHGLLAFSRPGYGRTMVGRLNASEFVPAVSDCCDLLGVSRTAGVVGVSFGGLQAIEVAVMLPHLAPRLVLHSCAPSTHSYPDTRPERLGGPVVFSPALQRLTWHTVSRLVASDAGLRAMVAALSNRPIHEWWHTCPSMTSAAPVRCSGPWTPATASATTFSRDGRTVPPTATCFNVRWLAPRW